MYFCTHYPTSPYMVGAQQLFPRDFMKNAQSLMVDGQDFIYGPKLLRGSEDRLIRAKTGRQKYRTTQLTLHRDLFVIFNDDAQLNWLIKKFFTQFKDAEYFTQDSINDYAFLNQDGIELFVVCGLDKRAESWRQYL
jgi:hypothetical protein